MQGLRPLLPRLYPTAGRRNPSSYLSSAPPRPTGKSAFDLDISARCLVSTHDPDKLLLSRRRRVVCRDEDEPHCGLSDNANASQSRLMTRLRLHKECHVGSAMLLFVVLVAPESAGRYGVRSRTRFAHASRRCGARTGNTAIFKVAMRAGFWGAVAMGLTAGIGRLVGAVVSRQQCAEAWRQTCVGLVWNEEPDISTTLCAVCQPRLARDLDTT
jgi:hypothetical protein